MEYEIYRWRYKCKGACFIIYARKEETADAIIEVENTSNIFFLKPARLWRKKACLVSVPPYELELEQMKEAERGLAHRLEYIRTRQEP